MATEKSNDTNRKDTESSDKSPSDSSSQSSNKILEKASREATEDDHTVA